MEVVLGAQGDILEFTYIWYICMCVQCALPDTR